MTAVPARPTDVTRPDVDTFATNTFDDAYVNVAPSMTPPSRSRSLASSCTFAVCGKVRVFGVTEIDVGMPVMETGTVFVRSPVRTEIVAVPAGPTDVTTPVFDTVTIAGSLDSNVTATPDNTLPPASTTDARIRPVSCCLTERKAGVTTMSAGC